MKRIITFAVLAVLMVLPSYSQTSPSPSFDEVLTTRRSIRNYDATKKITEVIMINQRVLFHEIPLNAELVVK